MTPQGTAVTYRNDSGKSLTVTSDEFFFATLLPGQSKKVYTRESLLPDHLRATDDRDQVVYEHTLTWEELKTSGFLVIIK